MPTAKGELGWLNPFAGISGSAAVSGSASLPPPAAAPHLEPEYLTPRELAELLRVSEATVYRWASEDATMPALRLGKTLRFNRERLTRWLRDREQGHSRPRQIKAGAKS